MRIFDISLTSFSETIVEPVARQLYHHDPASCISNELVREASPVLIATMQLQENT